MKSYCGLLVVAAACASPPRIPAPTEGSAHHFQIGALEAFALEDGHLMVANDGKLFGVGHSTTEIADVLATAGLPRDTIRLDIQTLLVKTVERVILFDTGVGDTGAGDPSLVAGHLMQSLAKAGVDPAMVTDILISHAHGDHVGGLVTKSGVLAFPSATIRMSAAEWASLEAQPEPDARRLVAAIAAKVVVFDAGAQVRELPEVTVVATPGHTPGHSSYEIRSGADKLFYLGDVAHHSVLSVERPAWSIEVDQDPLPAEAMRQQTLVRLAAEHERTFADHFPFPGIGYVVADADGILAWQPDGR